LYVSPDEVKKPGDEDLAKEHISLIIKRRVVSFFMELGLFLHASAHVTTQERDQSR
jgi:hypothetical protein